MCPGTKSTSGALVIRLIKEKANVTVKPSEIMGKKVNNAFIVRINDKKPDSSWHQLTEGLRTGNNFDRDLNVFINYQLTNRRADLAKSVRMARKDRKIAKYNIDQNGRIRIKKSADDKDYITVKSNNHLKAIIE